MFNIFETLINHFHPNQAEYKVMPLNAIWFVDNNAVHISTGKTHRITEGDLILVADGKLQDCTDKDPTHQITGCYGKIDNTELHIVAINLITSELVRIDF